MDFDEMSDAYQRARYDNAPNYAELYAENERLKKELHALQQRFDRVLDAVQNSTDTILRVAREGHLE